MYFLPPPTAPLCSAYNGDAHVADMQQQTLGTTPSSVLALSLSKALAIAPHIDDGARDATTTNADTNTDRSPSPSPRKKKDRKNHKKKDPTVSETMCFMDCDGGAVDLLRRGLLHPPRDHADRHPDRRQRAVPRCVSVVFPPPVSFSVT